MISNALIAFGLAPGMYPEDITALEWGVASPHIGKAIWHDYVPTALAQGKFQAKPDPHVIKGGLAKVQEGINILRKGVSAKKLVIEIGGEA